MTRLVNVRTAARSSGVHAALTVAANGDGQDRRTLCQKGSRGALDTDRPVNCGACLAELASGKWDWLTNPSSPQELQNHHAKGGV